MPMKKDKLLLVIFSFVIIFGIIYKNAYTDINYVYGNQTISEDEADKIRTTRQYDDEKIDLYYNKIKLPFTNGYDEYILPQEVDESFNGLLTCPKHKIAIIKDTDESKQEMMKSGKKLAVLIYDNNYYKTVYINLSNMPVVEICDIDGSNQEDILAKFRIIDIGNKGRYGIVNEEKFDIYYHVRGGTSVLFPKKSYKINLKQNTDDKYSSSLADMRKDDDWILNAMFIDDSKIREQFSYDVLNNFYGYNDENLQYCEVIINEEYLGLYNLQVPYDYKFFKMKKSEDLLTKIKLYRANFEQREIFNDISEKKQYIDEFNIVSHELIDYNKAIDILRKTVYEVYGYSEVPSFFDVEKLDMEISFDIESSAKYTVLLNLIGAADNGTKNQILQFIKQNDKSYLLKKHPWDLDYSLGEDFFGATSIDGIYGDDFLPPSVLNSTDYFLIQKSIYKEARNSFYNLDVLNDILDKHYLDVKNGGAIIREYSKWYDDNINFFENDVKIIRKFIENRIELLDKYYGYEKGK